MEVLIRWVVNGLACGRVGGIVVSRRGYSETTGELAVVGRCLEV